MQYNASVTDRLNTWLGGKKTLNEQTHTHTERERERDRVTSLMNTIPYTTNGVWSYKRSYIPLVVYGK